MGKLVEAFTELFVCVAYIVSLLKWSLSTKHTCGYANTRVQESACTLYIWENTNKGLSG